MNDFRPDQKKYLIGDYGIFDRNIRETLEMHEKTFGERPSVDKAVLELSCQGIINFDSSKARPKGVTKLFFYSAYVASGEDFKIMGDALGISEEKLIFYCKKFRTLPSNSPRSLRNSSVFTNGPRNNYSGSFRVANSKNSSVIVKGKRYTGKTNVSS